MLPVVFSLRPFKWICFPSLDYWVTSYCALDGAGCAGISRGTDKPLWRISPTEPVPSPTPAPTVLPPSSRGGKGTKPSHELRKHLSPLVGHCGRVLPGTDRPAGASPRGSPSPNALRLFSRETVPEGGGHPPCSVPADPALHPDGARPPAGAESRGRLPPPLHPAASRGGGSHQTPVTSKAQAGRSSSMLPVTPLSAGASTASAAGPGRPQGLPGPGPQARPHRSATSEAAQQARIAHAAAREVLAEPLRAPQPGVAAAALRRRAPRLLRGALAPRPLGGSRVPSRRRAPHPAAAHAPGSVRPLRSARRGLLAPP